MQEGPPWSTRVVTPLSTPTMSAGRPNRPRDVGVDVGMGVDHAGQHDAAADSMVSRDVAWQILGDRGDAAVTDGDVGRAVPAGGGIDDMATAQQ